MTRSLWPATEAAQCDYETLRSAVLADLPLIGPAGSRFARGGLAALIARPVTEPVFVAAMKGAARARWTPHADPRWDALAAGYQLVLNVAADTDDDHVEVAW